MTQAISLVWFRRDLRTFDHSALQAAVRHGLPIIGVFVLERPITDALPADDKRMTFIHQCLQDLRQRLAQYGVPLLVLDGAAADVLPEFAVRCGAAAVFCAEDYEPAARLRDTQTAARLIAHNITFHALTDQVLLAKSAVVTQQGKPYAVFSAYKKAWLALAAQQYGGWQPQDDWEALAALQSRLPERWRHTPALPSLAEWGFRPQNPVQNGGETAAQAALAAFLPQLADYAHNRDFPAKKGTSQLSPHLRFGTLSVRHLVYLARQANHAGAEAWLNELIWREFFQQLLYHYPDSANESFRAEYRRIAWENRADYLTRWQSGQTGYPLVDAAMRQLAQTGIMHNRLRMLCASFLCKDLLTDWRTGADWFAAHLLDFDLAANCGNWQWAAGTGCDAQPYFRVFNPVLQSQKFDPEGRFIRRYVPELAHLDKNTIHAPWLAKSSVHTFGYPQPVVQHAEQRAKILALFQAAKDSAR